MEENVNVVVRIRPLQYHEKKKNEIVCVSPAQNGQEVQVKTSQLEAKCYRCNKCFSRDTSQQDFFENSGITNLLSSTWQGYRASVIAFGQTGSGKTYTMVGEKNRLQADSNSNGIMGRSLDYLFENLERLKMKYTLRISCIEIYHENIYDLFNNNNYNNNENSSSNERDKSARGHGGVGLALREHPRDGFFVVGCNFVECRSRDEALEALNIALSKRHIGSHDLNNRSNRSHCVTEISVESPAQPLQLDEYYQENNNNNNNGKEEEENDSNTEQEYVVTGKISLVDLAGSERLKDTNSTGQILKDTGYINRSLYVLGQVIIKLSAAAANESNSSNNSNYYNHSSKDSVSMVPYRDSKLTKLLYTSLGGSGRTLLVACVSEASGSVSETLRTLTFSMSAARIKNRPIRFLDPREKLILELQEEIKILRDENLRLRSVVIDPHYLLKSQSQEGSALSNNSNKPSSSSYNTSYSYGNHENDNKDRKSTTYATSTSPQDSSSSSTSSNSPKYHLINIEAITSPKKSLFLPSLQNDPMKLKYANANINQPNNKIRGPDTSLSTNNDLGIIAGSGVGVDLKRRASFEPAAAAGGSYESCENDSNATTLLKDKGRSLSEGHSVAVSYKGVEYFNRFELLQLEKKFGEGNLIQSNHKNNNEISPYLIHRKKKKIPKKLNKIKSNHGNESQPQWQRPPLPTHPRKDNLIAPLPLPLSNQSLPNNNKIENKAIKKPYQIDASLSYHHHHHNQILSSLPQYSSSSSSSILYQDSEVEDQPQVSPNVIIPPMLTDISLLRQMKQNKKDENKSNILNNNNNNNNNNNKWVQAQSHQQSNDNNNETGSKTTVRNKSEMSAKSTVSVADIKATNQNLRDKIKKRVEDHKLTNNVPTAAKLPKDTPDKLERKRGNIKADALVGQDFSATTTTTTTTTTKKPIGKQIVTGSPPSTSSALAQATIPAPPFKQSSMSMATQGSNYSGGVVTSSNSLSADVMTTTIATIQSSTTERTLVAPTSSKDTRNSTINKSQPAPEVSSSDIKNLISGLKLTKKSLPENQQSSTDNIIINKDTNNHMSTVVTEENIASETSSSSSSKIMDDFQNSDTTSNNNIQKILVNETVSHKVNDTNIQLLPSALSKSYYEDVNPDVDDFYDVDDDDDEDDDDDVETKKTSSIPVLNDKNKDEVTSLIPPSDSEAPVTVQITTTDIEENSHENHEQNGPIISKKSNRCNSRDSSTSNTSQISKVDMDNDWKAKTHSTANSYDSDDFEEFDDLDMEGGSNSSDNEK